ncbi:B30.2/SPRY domain-containing protein [Entamoeba marina]
MSVCLKFLTFRDIRRFLQINSKCYETVKMLKVNPFFINSTIPIFDLELFTKVKCLKLPRFDEYLIDNKEEIKNLISKIKSFELSSNSEQTNYFIENAQLFTNIQRIYGELNEVVLFMKNFSNSGNEKHVSFPKYITITFNNGSHIQFSQVIINKVNELKSYIPNLNETTVYLRFCYHATPQHKELLFQLKNIHYSYYQITNEQCDYYSDHFSLASTSIVLVGVHYPNHLNNLFEKVHNDSCIVYNANEFCKDDIIWDIPLFITTCSIRNSRFFLSSDNYIILFNMKNIIHLKLSSCNDISFCNELNSLQYLSITESNYLYFKPKSDSIFTYCLNNLKELQIVSCDTVGIHLTKSLLHSLIINDSKNIKLQGPIENIQYIQISYSNSCEFPYISFENKIIDIEESNISFNNNSPLKYMDITLDDFNKLTKHYISCPFTSNKYDDKELFKMRKFKVNCKEITINNNIYINSNYLPFKERVKLISNAFYKKSNATHQIINSNGEFKQIPSTIHYFEVEVIGYAAIELGFFNRILYNLIGKETRAVGWDKHSIGYHSDDGDLYFGKGIGEQYGPKYGEEDINHIVGCGFNTITNEIFFVCDGIQLESTKVEWEDISSIITIEDFEELRINYGETPFKFDLERAINDIS